jgi:hypothetical protein
MCPGMIKKRYFPKKNYRSQYSLNLGYRDFDGN